MLRLAALLLLIPTVALADVEGPARVIDGDSLEVDGRQIRLYGIDAPEHDQTCKAEGLTWLRGERASLALFGKIGRNPVRCEERDRDKYGRIVSICFAAGEDVNRWMVREGWAVAYRRFTDRYVSAENEARAAGRNLWRGEFVMPWDWRRGKRRPTPKEGITDTGPET
jgi:endonuclease YncB( thermonuclease family)